MINDHTIHSVRELRARGLSPKEIARNLGMRPAAVADLVRQLAAERDAADPDGDVIGCWINADWSTGLQVAGHPEWHDPGTDDGTGGLASVVVARRRRNRRHVTTCVYLVDVHCLGVKNAMGPDTIDDQALRRLIDHVFSAHHAPPIQAPIELARDLVLGAADYAHGLGFAPHPDFEKAREHLGAWTAPSAITFGRDGKPNYIEGPYDDSKHVLATLHRAVGRNGFHYTIALNLDELDMTG